VWRQGLSQLRHGQACALHQGVRGQGGGGCLLDASRGGGIE
jgi:hypothetical protein